MDGRLPARYLPFALCIVIFLLALAGWNGGGAARVLALLSGALTAVGIADVTQKHSTLRRNYPILAHIRLQT